MCTISGLALIALSTPSKSPFWIKDLSAAVSCVSCHGRVDLMEEVWQEERLSMGWCLECHRNPEPHLRDPALVTNLAWKFDGEAEAEADYHERIRDQFAVNPSQDCSTCHR